MSYVCSAVYEYVFINEYISDCFEFMLHSKGQFKGMVDPEDLFQDLCTDEGVNCNV